jgi:ribonuclease HII
MLRYEKKAYRNGANLIAGIDEAGRGPLAGPVVAAAVILPREFRHKTLNDSKQLSPELREEIYVELTNRPDIIWSVGVSDVDVIDAYNILRATWRAMSLALDGLRVKPDHVLIDGLRVPVIRIPQTAIVKGDCKSFSIAAASVIAKVTRDRLMVQIHEQYPQYGFAQHKGYGTPEHLAALEQHGPAPVHRRSFAPVRQATEPVQTELFELPAKA